MAIKSPKNKGASGEREAAELLMAWAREIGHELVIERNLEQVRHGGADLNGINMLEVEVKRQQQYAMTSWWKQVQKAADTSGKIPLVMHRANNKKWAFRVRTMIAMEHEGSWAHFALAVDLDLVQGKIWFQEHVKLYHNGDCL